MICLMKFYYCIILLKYYCDIQREINISDTKFIAGCLFNYLAYQMNLAVIPVTEEDSLTYFMPGIPFYTSWKNQKTRNSLIIPGALEREQ